MTIWRTQVRFIGAGAIGVAAIYTLATTGEAGHGRPDGHARRVPRGAHRGRPDRDLSPRMDHRAHRRLSRHRRRRWPSPSRARPCSRPSAVTLTLIAVPFVLLVGFLIAGVCGYMAGLIGASNSPISGIGILSIVHLRVDPRRRRTADGGRPDRAHRLRAVHHVDRVRVRDDLERQPAGPQDRPARRRVADAPADRARSSASPPAPRSIPPVLNLLAKAYGFAGAANVGVVAPNPLPAPQATLISALAQGVVGGNLEWRMIGIGALVGVGLILLDTTLGAMKRLRLPPLAVGHRHLPADVGDVRRDRRRR